MRRLVAIVTAISFGLAAPAFAQNAPAGSYSGQPTQASQAGSNQPLLLDGQNAMAQDNTCAPGDNRPGCGADLTTGLLVGGALALTVGGVLWAINQNKSSSVSP